MADISRIARGALTAYDVRQAVTANNIANLNTPGFKASYTVQQENRDGGVTASVNRGEECVDISKEAADMLNTGNSYKANFRTLLVEDRMKKELLDKMG